MEQDDLRGPFQPKSICDSIMIAKKEERKIKEREIRICQNKKADRGNRKLSWLGKDLLVKQGWVTWEENRDAETELGKPRYRWK